MDSLSYICVCCNTRRFGIGVQRLEQEFEEHLKKNDLFKYIAKGSIHKLCEQEFDLLFHPLSFVNQFTIQSFLD